MNKKSVMKLMPLIFLFGILFFVFLYILLISAINFTPPTPSNDTSTTNKSVIINVSINYSLDEFKFNWDGTNYTIFNDSLVVAFNFENLSVLGECDDWGCNVTDLSGYGNNAQFRNDSGDDGFGDSKLQSRRPTPVSDGKYGGAMFFNATDSNDLGDSLLVLHNNNMNPYDNDFAMMLWFKCNYCMDCDVSRKGCTGTSPGNIMYKLEIAGYGTANLLSLQFQGSTGTATLQYDTPVCDGDWHFVVAQRTGNIAELWIDGYNTTAADWTGQTDNTVSGNINNSANLSIGSKDTQNDDFFNGTLDEYRLYINRSFSAPEIGILYMSNLYKYDTDKWAFYLNKTGLTDGNYTYQAFITDTEDETNQTEERTIEIYTEADTTNPNLTISSPKDNAYVIPNGSALLNWTIQDENTMEVWVWGSNNTNDLYENLLYYGTGKSSGELTYNWSAQTVNPNSEGLVLLFHLDNQSAFGENQTFVYDFSGQGHNGTMSSTFDMDGGKFGGCGSFDANNGIDVPSHTDIDFDTDENFTISFWFKTADTGAEEMIEKQDVTGGAAIFMQIRCPDAAGRLRVQLDDGSDPQTVFYSTANGLNDDKWHHAVLTREYHINATLYIDGIYDNSSGTDPSDSLAHSGNLKIGKSLDTRDFEGEIDEVAIWNRSLSTLEIADLYNLTAQKYYWQVNVTDTLGNTNSSGVYEFTLGIDSTPPQINITSPLNTTYTTNSINFNISSNEALSLCEFTINNWVTNYTMTLNSSNTGANYTNSTMSQGSHIAKFWCNDTSNNINNTESVTFFIDLFYPTGLSSRTPSPEEEIKYICWEIIGNSCVNYTINESCPYNYYKTLEECEKDLSKPKIIRDIEKQIKEHKDWFPYILIFGIMAIVIIGTIKERKQNKK